MKEPVDFTHKSRNLRIPGGAGVQYPFRRPVRGPAGDDQVRGARVAVAGGPGKVVEKSGAHFMRILYIFPHPDDESFGPARAIAAQRRQGRDVYLLTLTRGEATKVRHKFGWTLEQMGKARYRELVAVATTLDLTALRVLSLPDGGLKELDPWTLEKSIRNEILRVEPHVIVTFPIHGISGFHDHIVTHFAVTHVYLDLHGPGHPWLQRLAFFTVASAPAAFPWHVNVTAPGEVDCALQATDSDMERFHMALDCYVTYADVIAQTKVHQVFDSEVLFKLFREDHKPPLTDLCEGCARSAGNGEQAFSVSEYSALRAGIFKASGSTDPMKFGRGAGWYPHAPASSSR